MPGCIPQIIICQNKNAQYKWYYSKVFVADIAINRVAIKMQKFANHPVRVGRNPKDDGQVVGELAHNAPGTPCNDNGNSECRKNH